MRTAKLGVVLLSVVVLVALAPAALAEGRVALVVGNGTYAHISWLPNPGNDAVDMTAALRRLGFEVTTVRDADRVELAEALRVFTRESADAEVSLVFYAGHGLEMDGVNYLVPVDARLERDTDVRFEAVTLDDVLASTVGAGLRVVILDACRNNPLARSMQRSGATRSVSRGSFGDLDESLLGNETLVAYAAEAGTTADDGEGRNSPYTSALLSHLEQPLEIGLLFREVRARVLKATEGRQRPHEYASLLGEHYLGAAAGDAVGDAAVSGREQLFWEAIADSDDPEDYRAYLEEFPQGVYVRLARNRLSALGASEVAGAPPPSASAAGLPVSEGASPLDVSRPSAASARLALLTTVLSRELSASEEDRNGWTDLHYAALLDAPAVVRRLVVQGANVNARLRRDGKSLDSQLEDVLRRVGHEALSGWTRDGETALHVAATVGAHEAAIALLALGARVDLGTKFDWRPLHYAAWGNASEVIQLFLRHGAKIDARTDEVNRPGETPLQIAVAAGNARAAQALRAHGAR